MQISRCLFPVLFSALLSISAARADEWTKQWTVGEKPELRISTNDASIAVEVGSANNISARVRTRGVAIGNGGLKIEEHQTGNRVEIDIREPNAAHWGFNVRSVEVTIRVPRDLLANLHTGDGSVKLSGLRGSIRVDTGDGSIQADGLDGALEARSGDGSMHVQGRFDDLQIRTQDGSVDLQANSGSHLRSDWHVETGDGSVHLGIPRDLAANVQLRTGDGSIHVDLPLTIEGTKEEHSLRGRLNGGGPFLDVRTGDGSISLGGL